MSNIQFTDHAIDRFIQRHTESYDDPTQRLAHREEVRRYLEEHAPLAVRLKQKTFSGQFLWKIGDYRVVTKRDNNFDVAVTILPEVAPNPRGYSPDELERIQEYLERCRVQEKKLAEELAAAEAARQEAQDVFKAAEAISERKPSPAAQELKLKTRAARSEADAHLGYVRKSAGFAREMLVLERANLKDWEKTVRHGMRGADEEHRVRQLVRFVKDLDLPEGHEILRTLGYTGGGPTPETPEDSPQPRTEPYESLPQGSSPA